MRVQQTRYDNFESQSIYFGQLANHRAKYPKGFEKYRQNGYFSKNSKLLYRANLNPKPVWTTERFLTI